MGELDEASDEWKKHGITLFHKLGKHRILSEPVLEVSATDKNGDVVGHAEFELSGNDWEPQNVNVVKEYQRMGIASAMYAYAEEVTGWKVSPSQSQTTPGKMLWKQKNRPFGKLAVGENDDLQEFFASLMLPDREQNYEVLQGVDHSKDVKEWIGKDDPYVEKSEWEAFLEYTRELGLSDNAARTIMNYNSGGYGIPWTKVKDAAPELETFAEHSGPVYRIHHYSKPDLIIKNHGDISVGDMTEIKSPKHLLSTTKKPERTDEYVETGEYHVVFEIDVQPQNVFIDFTELPKKMQSLLHYPKDAESEVVLKPGNYKARVVKLFHQAEYNKKVDAQSVGDWIVDEWGIPATGFYSDKFNKI